MMRVSARPIHASPPLLCFGPGLNLARAGEGVRRLPKPILRLEPSKAPYFVCLRVQDTKLHPKAPRTAIMPQRVDVHQHVASIISTSAIEQGAAGTNWPVIVRPVRSRGRPTSRTQGLSRQCGSGAVDRRPDQGLHGSSVVHIQAADCRAKPSPRRVRHRRPGVA